MNVILALIFAMTSLLAYGMSTQEREQRAKSFLKAGKFDKVIELLNPYTEQVSATSLLDLAGAYHEKSDYQNEVRILKFVSQKDEENPQIYFILGHAVLNQMNKEKDLDNKKKLESEAIVHFRTAVDKKPKFKPAYEALLNVFVKNESNYEARGVLNDMIKRFGKRPQYLNDLCRLYSIDGYLNQAIETCTEAIKISRDYPDNYVYLAQSYFDKKMEDKSGRIITLAAQKFTKSEIVQWAAGRFYSEKKNFPVAAKYFDVAVRADSEQSRSRLGLATALFSTEKYEDALPHYLKACQLDHSAVEQFELAASKLRHADKDRLAKKYSQQIYRCKAD